MKRLIILLMALYSLSAAWADSPSDFTGQWYGSWEIEGPGGFGGNFSMKFVDGGSYGVWAVMTLAELGLFEEYIPVAIDEGPTETVVTIGIAGYFLLEGILDGDTLAGTFYALADGDPPVFYSGVWAARKYMPEELVLGDAPGPQCNDLPELHCVGDVFHCTELVQFSPSIGDGWADYPANFPETEEDQVYSYIRRDLMQLVQYATAKVACKTADWAYGNMEPLALGDMSEADGTTPALMTLGVYHHPPGTHENGRDIDTAYYQVFMDDNRLRPVCVHYDSHCIDTPYALDFWRTALYLAYLSEHPLMRVVGVDGQVGLVLEDALDALVEAGWISSELRASIPLAYEVTDTGRGWFKYHHHHNHISMNYVYDAVANVEIQPDTLNRDSRGKYVTVHLELYDHISADRVDGDSLALTLNGHTMLYAEPGSVTLSDFNENGITDLTAKFDREKVAVAVESGQVEIAITGLIDGQYFFQASDTIFVIGRDFRAKLKLHPRYLPEQSRPGNRRMVEIQED